MVIMLLEILFFCISSVKIHRTLRANTLQTIVQGALNYIAALEQLPDNNTVYTKQTIETTQREENSPNDHSTERSLWMSLNESKNVFLIAWPPNV